ncbi:GntR family transcriptional regulator [Sediminibacillus albus]|uniref:GntR family transcriptional regulator, arabinose operon transcriptional repressor n=1 Tax=Sediminibacillus albus TaxID=407036 RepID=A0A1G8ZZ43_9BACI|nr:GntR family transcriptional regulator [Sediminibacillus albus]SDK19420.1 GntR family transcriptional regulator, arabinose operon transcriptional repressor [Sediminibacillus albus]
METKHNMVKQAIKTKIMDGTFLPNQKISSESELMKQFNVSRHTVRLAIGDLVNQGWLYREQGAGTFCADRSLEDNRSKNPQKNIAIITTYISDYIFPSIIRGAESYLSEQGYQVSLFSTNNDHENERALLERMIEQKFDGIIIEPTKSAYSNPNLNYFLNLEHIKIPYIMINAYYDELEPVSLVMDDERGGYLQTDHLIRLGHKEIVGLFKTDDIQGTLRMKGYLKAHRGNQLSVNPKNILMYNTDEKDDKPISFLEDLLSADNSLPTAIVCYNDELAIKLLDVLRQKKLRVPEDISIVGYDDSFLAQVSEVKLTTISHPKTEMGKKAGQMIVDLIKSKKGSKRANEEMSTYVFEPDLIIRSSTAELKKEKEITS